MGEYNQFAQEYAEKSAEMETAFRNHYRSFLPKNLKGKKILDVGCGSGQDAGYYAKQGAEVCGIDLSEKQVELAQKLGYGQFKVGDMKKLPYTSNSFDYVTSYYALQTSDKVPKALAEMVRVAKKGSIILIQTTHPFRNLLEGWKNDGKLDYYAPGKVTSRIFNRTITLKEPSHTLMEYFNAEFLKQVELLHFEEQSDFPASEQVIKSLKYPTYMILKFRKK